MLFLLFVAILILQAIAVAQGKDISTDHKDE